MSARFNKPPGWPQPPADWKPTPGWAPGQDWPTAPMDWKLWLSDTGSHQPAPPSAPTRPADEPCVSSTLLPMHGSLVLDRAGTDDVESLASAVLGLSTPTRQPAAPSRPNPARIIGGAAVGIALLAVAGITIGNLAGPSSTPVVDTPAPTFPASASVAGSRVNPVEQAIAAAEPGTALAALADLTVRRRGSSTGYARASFGSPLRDTDGNGCDQRNDVLRRDLNQKTLKAGTNGCAVLTGNLTDPYTGRNIPFDRTTDGATQVSLDHVVPLADAWMKGARSWSATKRARFATDPLNLQAVGARATAGKRGSDAVRWLPRASGSQCPYVARQIAVKRKYGVWVTAAERTAIAQLLSGCDGVRPPRATRIALGGAPVAKAE
jgi:uncharacterized protein DUF1524